MKGTGGACCGLPIGRGCLDIGGGLEGDLTLMGASLVIALRGRVQVPGAFIWVGGAFEEGNELVDAGI